MPTRSPAASVAGLLRLPIADRIELERRYRVLYSSIMTAKEKVIQAVQDLPDDASIEDAMARLLLLAKVERGLREADAGHLIDHSEVKGRMAKCRG
jgi:predicted transcriptional regulator